MKFTHSLDEFKLTQEEADAVSRAINSDYPNVDIIRNDKRVILNLKNYKEFKEL